LFYSLIKIYAPTASLIVISPPSTSSIKLPVPPTDASRLISTDVSTEPLKVKFTVAITPSPSFDGRSLDKDDV
jgi:hypothetical protein